MSRLTGIGVLVTRPEHQANHLCQLIEAEGGAAVRYPALVTLVFDHLVPFL